MARIDAGAVSHFDQPDNFLSRADSRRRERKNFLASTRMTPSEEISMPRFWGELAKLIRDLHRSMYEDQDLTASKKKLPKLRKMLKRLPTEIEAIVHAEALAIYHELMGDNETALSYRVLEISLIERLHAEVANNIRDQATKEFALQGRTPVDLQVRMRIADSLRNRNA